MIEKHLKYLDFVYDNKELTIYRITEDLLGGHRESFTIPKRNLYSLLVFIIRILRNK